MSTLGFGSLSPAAAAPAPAAVEDTSSHWAPHGAALTAFVVGINVLVIVLIFFFFCRFFSRKGEDDSASDGADDPLPVASPWASRRRRRRETPAARALDDVASALPVYVYSSSADDAVGGGKTKAPTECAVCIVELRDGDSARRLPRCGHRFHADCVGADDCPV